MLGFKQEYMNKIFKNFIISYLTFDTATTHLYCLLQSKAVSYFPLIILNVLLYFIESAMWIFMSFFSVAKCKKTKLTFCT